MTSLKNTWIKLSTRLDAMTLRERALVFVTATGLILFLLYTTAVEPMLARQKMLLEQIQQQQQQVAAIDVEIAARAQGFVVDPDAPVRAQLLQARGAVARVGANLLAVQKGLVAPEKIAPLLGQLLRGNGKLKLVSLRTLPVTGMSQAAVAVAPGVAAFAATAANVATAGNPAAGAAAVPAPALAAQSQPQPQSQPVVPTSAAAAPSTAGQPAGAQPGASATVAVASVKPGELLYRHGVEVVLQGGYLDMINYMQALEALPAQLFWGAARLDAQQYPEARLTLTLYTLSLDEKWMKL